MLTNVIDQNFLPKFVVLEIDFICSVSELFRRCFVHFTIDNTINVLNSFDLLILKTKTNLSIITKFMFR